MNIKLISCFSALAGMLLLSGSAFAIGVNVTVNFGNPPKDGSACIGKGICKGTLLTPNTIASGTSVKFAIFPIDSTDLIMAFSMSDLTKKQPDQVANFTNGGSYYFESTYYFDPVMYADAHLKSGAYIDASTINWVEINLRCTTHTNTANLL